MWRANKGAIGFGDVLRPTETTTLEITALPLNQQYFVQRHINVVVAAPYFLLTHKAALHQRFHIFRRGEPGHLEITLNEIDLGVGVQKQAIDQILAKELVAVAYAVLGQSPQLPLNLKVERLCSPGQMLRLKAAP